MLTKCNLCNRQCNINRDINIGFCKATNDLKVAKIMTHKWEEPIISGSRGSGAIFFSHCNLRCVYCQNYKISDLGHGEKISINQLVEIFKHFENLNVHNINLVTPSHYATQIVEALQIYKPKIPIVWNTNSYETLETMQLIKNYIDIYLFDLKYYNNETALKYSSVNNYFEIATRNILFARSYIPKDEYKDGIMTKGIIIRHLVLPNHTNESIKILEWIANNTPNTILSLMSQYTPYHKAKEYPEINRKLQKLEYKRVLTKCNNLHLNGFMQSIESANEYYIPDFE